MKVENLLAIAFYVGLLGVFGGCHPHGYQSTDGGGTGKKELLYDDFEYETTIKTVQLYPSRGNPQDVLEMPVVPLNDNSVNLILEFDELGNQYRNYNYKLLHCNYDWSPSIVQDMEILNEYNEFTIDRYEISNNTRKNYVHYWVTVPKVKISGNYILKVYRNGNQDDLIITRRFVVVDNKLGINTNIRFPLDVSKRFTHQQVDFTINYSNVYMFNPREMLKVMVRQNGRSDNMKKNLQPLFIREEESKLDFSLVDNSNVFTGGNEFRWFDIRSIRFQGRGVEGTSFDNEKAEAILATDQSRNEANYTQYIDFNGRYVIDNYETNRGATEADYVYSYFSLKTPRPMNGDVYVFGLFTDWRMLPEYKMRFDSSRNMYRNKVLLKQGFYNYKYVVDKGRGVMDDVELEGTYNQTENFYEILAYMRPIGARYDHCIGYKRVGYFER